MKHAEYLSTDIIHEKQEIFLFFLGVFDVHFVYTYEVIL